MTKFSAAGAVSAAALLAGLGAPALADVTAEQVWADFKASYLLAGEESVSIGSEDYAGGVLTVTDVGLDFAGTDGVTVTGSLAEVVLTENGDGTVTVTMSEDFPLTVTSPADGSVLEMAIRQAGMTLDVSGDPGAMTYDLAASRYAVELVSVTQNGAPVEAQASLALNDLAGAYTVTGMADAERTVDYDLQAASTDLLVDFANPTDGSTVSVSGTVADIATNASAVLPAGLSMVPATPGIPDGLSVEGGYTTGASDYTFAFADASGPTNGTVTSEGGELSFAVSDGAVGYDSVGRGLAVQVTSAQLPFPIEATLAESGATLLMPLAQSEGPVEWALGLNLLDLSINEEVWALFDPEGQLPRDPATVVMDLTGTATLFADLTDPAVQAAGTPPGEVNSVSINDLNLSVAGAQVTGTGAFTFDNADLVTFQGIPRPEGSAEFQLSGVNGLIDTLVSMGLIPEEQVMGARMVLGLLAVPVGDDQLESRIEVTPDGALLANGQRLQ